MEALSGAAAHVTGGNGHFVSGYRKLSSRVEARDDRDDASGDGDDKPVRPTVATPVQAASSSSDAAVIEL